MPWHTPCVGLSGRRGCNLREPFRILVADRNRHVREFLKRELASQGFLVETVGDGKELLDGFGAGRIPDLLVLDLELPLLDGCQVASRLKELGIRIPIVIHSFLPEGPLPSGIEEIGRFVEKSGENIQMLLATICSLLGQTYPARSSDKKADESDRIILQSP
jgi:FixJ family two-component response regulator